MRRKLLTVLFVIALIIGIGVLTYPTISNQWNTYRQNQLIDSYKNIVDDMTEEDYSEAWAAAEAFNSQITTNSIYGDVFNTETAGLENTEYWQVLNVAGNGVMGYINIPKINVELAIYHGTGEDVLETGVGHLNGTKLPIGGESNHSVLAAHRGLPTAKLFTDIDQLEIGDMFYLHVLDQTLAYQVDQILPMVEKDDMDTLSSALAIEDGKDYVTLFTCTPYGVNTHRLLVRGTRVAYNGEDDVQTTGIQSMVQAVQDYYMLFLIAAVAIIILVSLILRRLFRKKEADEGDEDKKE